MTVHLRGERYRGERERGIVGGVKHLAHVACLLASIASTGCLASIRPPTSDPIPGPLLEARGRERLSAAARAHGREAWSQTRSLSYRMTDAWQGLLGALGNPWPESMVDVRMELRTGTFDARATFMTGDEAGTTWGMQSWRPYEVRPGGAPRITDDGDTRFILAAIQYLLEFPFRASAAPLVADAGSTEVDGRAYDLVFVTWGSWDAHADADQYVVYIARESGRVEKISYTIREFARFATGTIHFSEFRDAGGGLLVPTVQVITGAADDSADDHIHVIRIDPATLERNTVPPSTFVVDPSLPIMGDQKPS